MRSLNISQLLGRFKGMPPRLFWACLWLCVIILVVGDYCIFTRMQIGALTSLRTKTAKMNEEIASLKANMQRMDLFRANLDEARQQVEKFERMVHRSDDVPELLKRISTTANTYHVTIDQLVPQKSDGTVLVKSKEGNYRSLPIMINARAGYHDLGRFLNRLEQLGVYWQLDNVSITANSGDPAHHNIKIRMKVLVLGD